MPVDDGALGEVGEVALDPGEGAQEDESGALEVSVFVEPAEALGLPVGFHVAPGRDLHVAGRGAGSDEGEMVVSGDRLEAEGHAGVLLVVLGPAGPGGVTAVVGRGQRTDQGVPEPVSRARVRRASARTSARWRPVRSLWWASWVRQE